MMPAETDVPRYLRTLAERTADELWKVARHERTDSHLVLPRYRGGRQRVSEQESRSIAQRLVADSEYYFSIETPTDGTYNFTGKEGSLGRSAQHDMTLYSSADPASLVAHIEFKQGHRSGDTGVQVIAKDLRKLVGSARHSLWFHSFPLPTVNEFQMLRTFFGSALLQALASGVPDEPRVVLAFCSVIDPVAWLAGPITWSDVPALIEGFPEASANVHPGWSRVVPDDRRRPSPAELVFVDDPLEASTGDS